MSAPMEILSAIAANPCMPEVILTDFYLVVRKWICRPPSSQAVNKLGFALRNLVTKIKSIYLFEAYFE
jgi:hypothetical protein